MLEVRRWAEIRRMKEVEGLSIREIVRRTGHDRNTVRRALRSSDPPRYSRPPRPSKLDPHRNQIQELLRRDPRIPGKRIGELIAEHGYKGSKTILDDYLREIRPLYLPKRTFQRTVYRRGEICQFDLWRPSAEVPVGHGQTRAGFVVVAALGYSRAGAGALIFRKRPADILWGIGRCLKTLGALPETIVWDREGAIHRGGGEPTDALAAFCGQLGIGWHFCEPADPQAKGVVERLQGFAETNFEPGRSFANELDFADQLAHWFARANARTHRTTKKVPAAQLLLERQSMRPLPDQMPATAERQSMRVPAQPFARFDRNDYSLDPRLVGRRVELVATQREIIAICHGSGEIAARHRRRFAGGPTITDPAHQRLLEGGRSKPAWPEVEIRPLARYDRLIPA